MADAHRPDSGGADEPRLRPLFGQVEEILGCTALVIVVLAAGWGVFTRYVTHTPATWTSEAATTAFAWAVFIGAAAAFKRGGHVSIDMLITALPPRAGRLLQAATDIVVLAFCLGVAALATQASIANWDNPTSVLRVPVATIYIALALGFAFMALRQCESGWARWTGRAWGV